MMVMTVDCRYIRRNYHFTSRSDEATSFYSQYIFLKYLKMYEIIEIICCTVREYSDNLTMYILLENLLN